MLHTWLYFVWHFTTRLGFKPATSSLLVKRQHSAWLSLDCLLSMHQCACVCHSSYTLSSGAISKPSGADFPACWQTYISALDEDLGKAQARMDGILSADGTSTSKQNEMLKAAAKQVCVCVCVSDLCSSVCVSVCVCMSAV